MDCQWPSRLSLHLPLYHWVVVCNLFVILCNNFPHSDGFLQIWSPWNWHPLLSLFFVLVCQHVTNICFPSLLPWHLPPSLAHSRVTDQHPLLSAYRIHLALTVWKDHLHVCDEEIIDIFSPGILCRRQSPALPCCLSFLLFLLSRSDTSSGIFKSGQSSCLLKCTRNYLSVQDVSCKTVQTRNFRSKYFEFCTF